MNKTHICTYCGKEFTHKPGKKNSCCSRDCATRKASLVHTINLEGQKFGRLTVLYNATEAPTKEKPYPKKKWMCMCDCGVKKIVGTDPLVTGKSKSCGCLNREMVSNVNRTHGESKTRLYEIWKSMRSRCSKPHNTGYSYYGGRGIRVCEEWDNDFLPFKRWAVESGYNDSLTIERIDPDGNYEPGNCTWATRKQQSINRRSTHYIEVNGERRFIKEWAAIIGVCPAAIHQAIRKGVRAEDYIQQRL